MTIDLELEPEVRARKMPAKAKTARARQEEHVELGSGLTAGDLIAMLEDLDPATPVVIEGQYGGFESARTVSRLPIRFNVNSLEGFGPHDRAAPGEQPHAYAVAVLVKTERDFAE